MGTPGCILIADDEPQLVVIMKRYLERLGYEVASAGTAAAAWKAVEADPRAYGVALVDISLPGMGGVELSRRMLEANPEMRVIASSGYPVDLQPLEAQAPGRVTFLHKPFTPEMLADTVKRLLA